MTSDPFASGHAPEADHAWVGPMAGAPQLVETFKLWLNDGPRRICINFGLHLRDGQSRTAGASIVLPGRKFLCRRMGDRSLGGALAPPILRQRGMASNKEAVARSESASRPGRRGARCGIGHGVMG